ncbi:MAG: hypothetical protein Q8O91_10680 [Candidatus Aminicenantes bacterium]|nr:hypothetical protein [Candidatus Aminicenantes bacterium]
MDPQAMPGALTRDVYTRLSTAETDPQTKPGAPAAAPAAVGERNDIPCPESLSRKLRWILVGSYVLLSLPLGHSRRPARPKNERRLPRL